MQKRILKNAVSTLFFSWIFYCVSALLDVDLQYDANILHLV